MLPKAVTGAIVTAIKANKRNWVVMHDDAMDLVIVLFYFWKPCYPLAFCYLFYNNNRVVRKDWSEGYLSSSFLMVCFKCRCADTSSVYVEPKLLNTLLTQDFVVSITEAKNTRLTRLTWLMRLVSERRYLCSFFFFLYIYIYMSHRDKIWFHIFYAFLSPNRSVLTVPLTQEHLQ